MPAGAEDHGHAGVGFLDHGLDVGVTFHSLGVRILGQVTEPQAERCLIRVTDVNQCAYTLSVTPGSE